MLALAAVITSVALVDVDRVVAESEPGLRASAMVAKSEYRTWVLDMRPLEDRAEALRVRLAETADPSTAEELRKEILKVEFLHHEAALRARERRERLAKVVDAKLRALIARAAEHVAKAHAIAIVVDAKAVTLQLNPTRDLTLEVLRETNQSTEL